MSNRTAAAQGIAAPVLLEALRQHGPIRNASGMASADLAALAEVDKLLVIETLKLLERNGQIVRTINGKRTTEIRLATPDEDPVDIAAKAKARAAAGGYGKGSPRQRPEGASSPADATPEPPPQPEPPPPPPPPPPPAEPTIDSDALAAALLRHVIDLAAAPDRSQHQRAQLERDLHDARERLATTLADNTRLRRHQRELEDAIAGYKIDNEGLRQRAQAAESNLKRALTAPPLDTERERQLRELAKVMQTKPGAYAGNGNGNINGRRT